MNINEQKTELLPIVIEGQTFKPNAEGLWSLNEIHQALGLDPAKIASKWSNEVRAILDQSRNFVIERGGANPGTWATEAGTIAYAMWVSPGFYLMVVDAFVTMRNDAILSARMSSLALAETGKLLADNMPKATALMLKAKGHGISWSDACRAARVDRPLLAKRYLLAQGKFQSVFDHDKGDHVLQPVARAFSLGFFKRHVGVFGNADGWRVTDKGVVWLEGRANAINEWAFERDRKKSQARREAPKAPKVTV
jgi:hypothetical protein|tara:strand:- start:43 stop:798 length:756 start_codon:yes stop_codon:yes gene_type:complete